MHNELQTTAISMYKIKTHLTFLNTQRKNPLLLLFYFTYIKILTNKRKYNKIKHFSNPFNCVNITYRYSRHIK